MLEVSLERESVCVLMERRRFGQRCIQTKIMVGGWVFE